MRIRINYFISLRIESHVNSRTRMRQLLRVFILFLATLPVLHTEWTTKHIGRVSMDETPIIRKRGSVVNLPVVIAAREGKRAFMKLIQGAKETPSDAFEFKYFSKQGGFAKALQDFKSLRPKAVIEFGGDGDDAAIMMGRVGDRKIILKRYGSVGHPTIELIKLVPKSTYHIMDVVSYVD